MRSTESDKQMDTMAYQNILRMFHNHELSRESHSKVGPGPTPVNLRWFP